MAIDLYYNRFDAAKKYIKSLQNKQEFLQVTF